MKLCSVVARLRAKLLDMEERLRRATLKGIYLGGWPLVAKSGGLPRMLKDRPLFKVIPFFKAIAQKGMT